MSASTNEVGAWERMLLNAERERDEALVKLARVEALADDHRQPGALIRSGEGEDAPLVWMTHIRAALNGYRIEWSSGLTGYHLVPLADPAPVMQDKP